MAFIPSLIANPPLYRGTGPSSLCRLFGVAVMAAATALPAGGCSFSYQLGSMFDKNKEQASVDATGSIPDTPSRSSSKPPATERDLAYARAAAAEVLRRGEQGASQPWENPETGARGTVTPIASAYSVDGFTCHDFLASYIRGGSGEDWMRGEACRIHQGNWEVRSMKPWKSP